MFWLAGDVPLRPNETPEKPKRQALLEMSKSQVLPDRELHWMASEEHCSALFGTNAERKFFHVKIFASRKGLQLSEYRHAAPIFHPALCDCLLRCRSKKECASAAPLRLPCRTRKCGQSVQPGKGDSVNRNATMYFSAVLDFSLFCGARVEIQNPAGWPSLPVLVFSSDAHVKGAPFSRGVRQGGVRRCVQLRL